MIRKATLSDLPYILNIIKNCTNHMINNKIFQWNENYPSKGIFNTDSKIDLSPSHLSVCISSLQDVKLFNSNFKTLKISYYNSLLFIPIAIAIIFFKLINRQFINEVEKKPNNILNYIFYSLFKLEKFILKYFNFPFGISIISVFKKV